jgi:hypothetical protein
VRKKVPDVRLYWIKPKNKLNETNLNFRVREPPHQVYLRLVGSYSSLCPL